MDELQSLLFSSKLDITAIKAKSEELKNKFSVQEIDYQIILAFSLDYEKIPILLPLLSEPKIEKRHFVHTDQMLLFHLLANNISFPLPNCLIQKNIKFIQKTKRLLLEKPLYEELEKLNKLDELKEEIKKSIRRLKSREENENEKNKEILIEIREKEKIEEIIEKDDIESFRLITSENNFDFNRTIKKDNGLFNYAEVPILLFCIEKKAIKCFKYALINGANPSLMSIHKSIIFKEEKKKEIWDGYGFAGAIGDIQIMKMIEDQGISINGNLIKGASKFHQNHIIHWAEKEHKNLLKAGLKESIRFYNCEGFDIIAQQFSAKALNSEKLQNNFHKIPLHVAAKYNSKEIGKLLISKGADLNSKGIIY